MRKCVLMLAAVLLLTAAVVCGSEPTTKLTVEVKNLEGKPVDRASVVVRFVEGKAMKVVKKHATFEMRTDQDGVAKVPEIPQGKIRIQVIAKNYQTFGEIYTVDQEEKTIEIKLNPPQAQFSAHQ
jgi:uncharacterized protein (DUF2141 family)